MGGWAGDWAGGCASRLAGKRTHTLTLRYIERERQTGGRTDGQMDWQTYGFSLEFLKAKGTTKVLSRLV